VEAATVRASRTPKKHFNKWLANRLAAAEAHLKLAEVYRTQTGTDHAGQYYLPEVTTQQVANGYADIHQLQGMELLGQAKDAL